MGICHEKMGISYTNMEKHRFFNQQMEDFNHKNWDSCGLIGMNGDLGINMGIQQLKDGGIYHQENGIYHFCSFFFPGKSGSNSGDFTLKTKKRETYYLGKL